MNLDPTPKSNPEREKQKEDDNARQFVVEPIDSQFLEAHGATPLLLITDWTATDKANEEKVVCKKFDNGDVQYFSISKPFQNGERKKLKQEIGEEKYKKLRGSSVRHVEKRRHEFAYTQHDISFTINYDEFAGGKLFLLDVDASSKDEKERNSFNPDAFPIRLEEVTGDPRYSGSGVANTLANLR